MASPSANDPATFVVAAALNGTGYVRGAVLLNGCSALNASLGNVEQPSSLPIAQTANWRFAAIAAVTEVRQLRCHHRPLTLGQMPASQVGGDTSSKHRYLSG